MSERLPSDIKDFLVVEGFCDSSQRLLSSPLTGGVASDIWRVETGRQTLCVKRALEQLKVAQVWKVSTERNAFEVRWFETVAALFSATVSEIAPVIVPTVLAHDAQAGLFAMDYFPPEHYPVWKTQLRNGLVEVATATKVAALLGIIHQKSAAMPDLVLRFDTLDLFYQIRIDPYFLTTAKQHPTLAATIESMAEGLSKTKIALVHGDVSPKNILVGPDNPVFLDAECAVYGDPAFDLAFLLNHLLLKSVWCPSVVELLLLSFQSTYETYLSYVDWEDKITFERRACGFLGVFLLARIDGKSPVEYIIKEADKEFVRVMGREILQKNYSTFKNIQQRWQKNFTQVMGRR